jgi:hypothetical protein
MAAELPTAYNPAKDVENPRKHGVSLELGRSVLDGATTTVIDDRFPYGEERLVTFGYVGQRLYVAVDTVRDESLRMISVRKANAREQARYG